MQSIIHFSLDAVFLGVAAGLATAASLLSAAVLFLPWLAGVFLCAACGVESWVETLGLALSLPWAAAMLGGAHTVLRRAAA